MTPREKAEQILDKCYQLELETVYYGVNHYLAKKFAFILLEEIISFEYQIVEDLETLSIKSGIPFKMEGMYWTEVKQEIENIDEEYKKADKEASNLMNKKTDYEPTNRR